MILRTPNVRMPALLGKTTEMRTDITGTDNQRDAPTELNAGPSVDPINPITPCLTRGGLECGKP